MLNRRNFLKTGAAALPLAAAIESLNQNFARSAETIADVAAGGATPMLIPLPARLAPIDPATLPWQQNIRRVGQSNMTHGNGSKKGRHRMGRLAWVPARARDQS